jgi:hypothetical protein
MEGGMKLKKVAAIGLWCVCDLLAWGMFIGMATCDYPQFNPIALYTPVSLFGPFSVGAALIFEGVRWTMEDKSFQFRLRPLGYEDRWRAFHEIYPPLSRYYFDHGHESDEPECAASDVTGCK